MVPLIGILQGRLTPSLDGRLQFFPKNSWQEEFFAAAKIGFDCIELLADQVGENPIWEDRGADQVVSLCLETGVIVDSIHGFYHRRSEYVAMLSRLIEQTAYIGARSILIPFFDGEVLDTQQKFETAACSLHQAGLLCEKLDVYLGIEAELETERMQELLALIGHRNVGIYYDIGNMASIGNNVAEEVKLFGNKIVGVHVKDRVAQGGKTVPLGTGCADFDAAFKGLAAVEYCGPLVLQPARVPHKDDVALQGEYLEFVRKKVTKYFTAKNKKKGL